MVKEWTLELVSELKKLWPFCQDSALESAKEADSQELQGIARQATRHT